MNLDDGVISEINQTQGKNCNILYMKAKKVKFIEGESRMVVTRSKEVREMRGMVVKGPKVGALQDELSSLSAWCLRSILLSKHTHTHTVF